MRVQIHSHAAWRYALSLYYSARTGRMQYNNKYADMLRQIQGQWVDIDTMFLFSNQLNTVPIEGVSSHGLRISHAVIARIEDDARDNPEYRCVDAVLLQLDMPSASAVYWRYKDIGEEKLRQLALDFFQLEGVNASDEQLETALSTFQGKRHHCRPIGPLVDEENYRKFFYFSDKRQRLELLEKGVISL